MSTTRRQFLRKLFTGAAAVAAAPVLAKVALPVAAPAPSGLNLDELSRELYRLSRDRGLDQHIDVMCDRHTALQINSAMRQHFAKTYGYA